MIVAHKAAIEQLKTLLMTESVWASIEKMTAMVQEMERVIAYREDFGMGTAATVEKVKGPGDGDGDVVVPAPGEDERDQTRRNRATQAATTSRTNRTSTMTSAAGAVRVTITTPDRGSRQMNLTSRGSRQMNLTSPFFPATLVRPHPCLDEDERRSTRPNNQHGGSPILVRSCPFHFDRIKIDRGFVSQMSESSESRAIVKAVAELGATLSMTTTAEGVETVDQYELVRKNGCTDVQGYYFGRPRPLAEL